MRPAFGEQKSPGDPGLRENDWPGNSELWRGLDAALLLLNDVPRLVRDHLAAGGRADVELTGGEVNVVSLRVGVRVQHRRLVSLVHPHLAEVGAKA